MFGDIGSLVVACKQFPIDGTVKHSTEEGRGMFAVAGLMSTKRRVTRSIRDVEALVKSMSCVICWHQEVIFCDAATV